MNIKEVLKEACRHRGMTQTELAEACGMSQSNLAHKLARGTLTLNEWEQLSEACGFKLQIRFIAVDGGLAYETEY